MGWKRRKKWEIFQDEWREVFQNEWNNIHPCLKKYGAFCFLSERPENRLFRPNHWPGMYIVYCSIHFEKLPTIHLEKFPIFSSFFLPFHSFFFLFILFISFSSLFLLSFPLFFFSHPYNLKTFPNDLKKFPPPRAWEYGTIYIPVIKKAKLG